MSLASALDEARGFRIGTERKWASGTFVKTAKGWVEKAAAGGKAVAKAGGAVKAKAPQLKASVAERIKSLPEDAKRLVTDSTFRSEVGAKMGQALRRKSVAAAKYIAAEVRELKDAGGALKKLALRQELTKHDKHALKAAAVSIATTVAGSIVLGGIGHLTANALAQHFVGEALLKTAGRAALFAHVVRSGWPICESDDAAVREVVERILERVAGELEALGGLSDEQAMELLTTLRQASAGEEETGGDDDVSEMRI